MSPLRMGSARVAAVSGDELAGQAAALAEAIEAGGDRLDAHDVAAADALAAKIRDRTSMTGSHTVVALAGATGSGKSTLFNAIVGAEVATIGARRPTTSTPTAAVWGDEPATELLDWLGVPNRHRVDGSGPRALARAVTPAHTDAPAHADAPAHTDESEHRPESAGEPAEGEQAVGRLDGLVLLDLPDFDSTVQAHRVEAQRVLELVDVFVWVTDPQKYADALLHDDYVSALATHDAVTLVVLNQVDRLAPEAVQECRDDLRRLLVADGLASAQVHVTSAASGRGIPELTQRIANAVAGENAARSRLSADVVAVATRLRRGVADTEVQVAPEPAADLVEALARAAGVPVVLDAVGSDYRRQATQAGGWVFTRWAAKLRPDPLSRLRLDRPVVAASVDDGDVRAVLGRSSIPAPSPSARAAVSLASRRLVDRAASGLPVPWADAVTEAGGADGPGLADALDQAVVNTPVRGRIPRWWAAMSLAQWVLGVSALVGLGWLIVLGVVDWLRLPQLPTPTLGELPWPFLLLAAGVVGGLAVAAITRVLARVGSRRRVAAVRQRLHVAIAEVARARITEPVTQVLAGHRRTREALELARRS